MAGDQQTHADVIVLGLGAMGSAALFHLARRGVRVLGIEQFDVAHNRGSSHGETRIIRKAYFEHPDYVPLLERAYGLWGELEEASGERLFDRTGLLLLGPPDGAVVTGVRRARAAHGLAIDDVAPAEVAARFPQFRCADGLTGLFEADAGQLRVEACVRAHAVQARTSGARIVTGQRVTGWSAEPGGVAVRTAGGTVRGGALVITAGAWSSGVLADLGLPLTVERRVQLWFGADDPALSMARGCPVFAYDLPEGFFYGFPARGGRMKAACHTGEAEGDADPDRLDRDLRPEDVAPTARFLADRVPGAGRDVVAHSVCMYTLTPDRHFVVDRHPDHDNVCFAAGFSGHGFKFAPLVGSVLADLATEGATSEPVGFLRMGRFGSDASIPSPQFTPRALLTEPGNER